MWLIGKLTKMGRAMGSCEEAMSVRMLRNLGSVVTQCMRDRTCNGGDRDTDSNRDNHW